MYIYIYICAFQTSTFKHISRVQKRAGIYVYIYITYIYIYIYIYTYIYTYTHIYTYIVLLTSYHNSTHFFMEHLQPVDFFFGLRQPPMASGHPALPGPAAHHRVARGAGNSVSFMTVGHHINYSR